MERKGGRQVEAIRDEDAAAEGKVQCRGTGTRVDVAGPHGQQSPSCRTRVGAGDQQHLGQWQGLIKVVF